MERYGEKVTRLLRSSVHLQVGGIGSQTLLRDLFLFSLREHFPGH